MSGNSGAAEKETRTEMGTDEQILVPQGTRCLRCGYVRQEEELAPEWQCPSCQVAYAKARGYEPPPLIRPSYTPAEAPASAGFGLKDVFTLLLIGLLLYGGYRAAGLLPDRGGVEHPIAVEEKEVVLYSTSWCGYCRKLKQFLDEKGVSYTEYDIEKEQKGKSDYEALQARGVPVLLVGDKRIDGYDPKRVERLLKAKGVL